MSWPRIQIAKSIPLSEKHYNRIDSTGWTYVFSKFDKLTFLCLLVLTSLTWYLVQIDSSMEWVRSGVWDPRVWDVIEGAEIFPFAVYLAILFPWLVFIITDNRRVVFGTTLICFALAIHSALFFLSRKYVAHHFGEYGSFIALENAQVQLIGYFEFISLLLLLPTILLLSILAFTILGRGFFNFIHFRGTGRHMTLREMASMNSWPVKMDSVLCPSANVMPILPGMRTGAFKSEETNQMREMS